MTPPLPAKAVLVLDLHPYGFREMWDVWVKEETGAEYLVRNLDWRLIPIGDPLRYVGFGEEVLVPKSAVRFVGEKNP